MGNNCDQACETPTWYPNIAETSRAHISSYSASIAAIAGMLNPKMLVFARARVMARLAAIITGDTVAAHAASKAATTAPAWQAALGMGSSGGEPRRIRCGRLGHLRRRRTLPRSARQVGGHGRE
ncbi:hypothetical protein NIIDMKKI_17140 [Mycobacterium kansasii]|uniref:Uncharacterized protein n=1 Tax=Mycobacterium kansasii TaxID=1768 RepID=A0A7G1IDH8_MYCKA|nr:hypothetical protein NIIDMKKI_17140 [Mycobacterium kansasii]